MTEPADTAGQRDRSPSYPIIPLDVALQRLSEFEAHFKRSPARFQKVGDAWNIKAQGYGDRIAAALRYFGLLEYQGTGKVRNIVVSEEGRKYLRAHQEETKREVVKAAALRPKQIAKFWSEWGADRPADAACLDNLVIKNGFSDAGAREFLKVYDATITYAKLSASDKITTIVDDEALEDDQDGTGETPAPPKSKVKLMDSERIVFTEENNPQQYVKLVASGDVDETLLDAIEDYVKRQKKRLLKAKEPPTEAASSACGSDLKHIRG